MKEFLRLHYNFIDDLRRAEAAAEKAGLGVTAGHLAFYADMLEEEIKKEEIIITAIVGESGLFFPPELKIEELPFKAGNVVKVTINKL